MAGRLLATLLAVTLGLAACGGDEEAPDATPTPVADATAGAGEGTAGADEAGCEQVEDPGPTEDTELDKPTDQLDTGKTYVATVETSCGTFRIELDAERAPKTGGSFKYLADQDFYDDTTFHRISPGFVIQGGDPLGEGTGGPGYSIVEAPPEDLAYTRGVVAMAKTAAEKPGTSGSQFFVVIAEDAQLPPEYALVGTVAEGMDVVDRIATVPTDPASERPDDPVVIRSIAIETAG